MGTWAVSEIKVGKDGMMIPRPMESRQMVTKIKIKADFGLMIFIRDRILISATKIHNSES
jgi:hypothetical protein